MFCHVQRSARAVFFFLLLASAPALAEVTVTQLANGGVLLSQGDTRVMIDGMVVEPYSIYAGLPADAAADFAAASGVFGGVDLVLASHRHHDHNQPAFACEFMQKSKETILVTSAEVIGLMREKCRSFMTSSDRVRAVDPQPGQPVVIEQSGARVTLFQLSHGKRKYAKIQNFGHLVELDGMRLLHIGDAAMDPEAFALAGMSDVAVDVAFIPAWFFQPGPGAAVIDTYLDAPLKIAVQVPPDEMAEARGFLDERFPGVMLLEPLAEIKVPKP